MLDWLISPLEDASPYVVIGRFKSPKSTLEVWAYQNGEIGIVSTINGASQIQDMQREDAANLIKLLQTGMELSKQFKP